MTCNEVLPVCKSKFSFLLPTFLGRPLHSREIRRVNMLETITSSKLLDKIIRKHGPESSLPISMTVINERRARVIRIGAQNSQKGQEETDICSTAELMKGKRSVDEVDKLNFNNCSTRSGKR